ncbi:MAG: hypothetical protein ICV65_06885 [Flavisolibacter sp.]|nr:hypothetical protein [Flavisolibacter sp.]
MNLQENIVYREEQSMRKSPTWVILILVILISLGLLIVLRIMDKITIQELCLVLLCILPIHALVLYLFYITRFQIRVHYNGIFYRWKPFHRKERFIAKETIRKFNIRNMPPLQYGVRWLPFMGWFHNVNSKKGIHFKLKNGNNVIIGVKNIKAFAAAVEQITSRSETKMKRL